MNTTIMANAEQTLEFHLRMIAEGIYNLGNYGEGIDTTESRDIYIYLNIFIGLMHDLGKTSCFFQSRLANSISGSKSKADIKEFHNWGYLYFQDLFTKFVKENKLSNNDKFINTLGYIGAICVLNHHFDLNNRSRIYGLAERDGVYFTVNSEIYNGTTLGEYIELIYSEGIIDKSVIKNIYSEIAKNTTNVYVEKASSFISLYSFDKKIFNTKPSVGISENMDLFSLLSNNVLTEGYIINRNIDTSITMGLLNFICLPNLIFIDKEVSMGNFNLNRASITNKDLIYDFYTKNFNNPQTTLNKVRGKFFDKMNSLAKENTDKKIHIISAPAGIGKFYSLMNYASQLTDSKLNKIVYIAPFISILEQNSDLIKKILKKDDNVNDENFSKINYLNTKVYKNTAEIGNDSVEYKTGYKDKYMLKSLNSAYIFTTFTNIFNSLYNFDNIEYIQTLNLLNNSVLIIDEIQDFDIKSLFFIKYFLQTISKFTNIKVIISSATMPEYITNELLGNDTIKYDYYKDELFSLTENIQCFNRNTYNFLFNNNKLNLLNNIRDITYESNDELLYNNIYSKIGNSKRVLFINNTIKMSEHISKSFLEFMNINGSEGEIIQSGKDKRLYKYYILNNRSKCKFEKDIIIDNIKNHDDESILLVFSTQLIKAGVDIDMDIAFCDIFNLLDLIQIGGRVNRNNIRNYSNEVFTYALMDNDKYDFKKIISDENNAVSEYIKYISNTGINDSIQEFEIYTKLLNDYNDSINISTKEYDTYIDTLDFDMIKLISKYIKSESSITFIKDAEEILFLNDIEKKELNQFFEEIDADNIYGSTINIKGREYNVNSFLYRIPEYMEKNYNIGDFKGYIRKNYNTFIL